MPFVIGETLEKLEIGEPQVYSNVAVYPLFSSLENIIPYRTLGEALADRVLNISEVSQGGSVPELAVENIADYPVLLLDGEELQGAKQNRVLNTTVLLKEHSKTVIPVSCTEQGRWSYNSNFFSDSGVVMNRTARLKKNVSVSDSMRHQGSFRSDQGEIWEEIHKMSSKRAFHSPTSAMKDVFEHSSEDMDSYLESFHLQENQKGFIIGINGHIAGMDYLSSFRAFGSLYGKLLKSYIMDALLQERQVNKEIPEEKANFFLKSIIDTEETIHPSVSYGYDHRYEARHVIASALVAEGELVHLAAFSVDRMHRNGPMDGERGFVSLHRRRNSMRRNNENRE